MSAGEPILSTTQRMLPVVGSPRGWARDFALMGAISGALTWGTVLLSIAHILTPIQTGYNILGMLLTHGALAAAMGGLLGVALERLRGRVGFGALWAGILALSGIWGALSVCISRVFFFSLLLPGPGEAAVHFAALGAGGAMMGVVVFGPLWLLYTMASVLQWRHRWLVVTASVLTGIVAYPLSHALIDLIQG